LKNHYGTVIPPLQGLLLWGFVVESQGFTLRC